MSTADTAAFAGWHRRGAGFAWRRLVEAESEAEAWVLLDALVFGGDKFVGAAATDPNRPPGRPTGERGRSTRGDLQPHGGAPGPVAPEPK
jgi:hypothetical protein